MIIYIPLYITFTSIRNYEIMSAIFKIGFGIVLFFSILDNLNRYNILKSLKCFKFYKITKIKFEIIYNLINFGILIQQNYYLFIFFLPKIYQIDKSLKKILK